MIYKTLHKKLKIEQRELHKNIHRFYWNEELLYYPGFSIFWKLYDSLKVIPLACLRVRCVPKLQDRTFLPTLEHELCSLLLQWLWHMRKVLICSITPMAMSIPHLPLDKDSMYLFLLPLMIFARLWCFVSVCEWEIADMNDSLWLKHEASRYTSHIYVINIMQQYIWSITQ